MYIVTNESAYGRIESEYDILFIGSSMDEVTGWMEDNYAEIDMDDVYVHEFQHQSSYKARAEVTFNLESF